MLDAAAADALEADDCAAAEDDAEDPAEADVVDDDNVEEVVEEVEEDDVLDVVCAELEAAEDVAARADVRLVKIDSASERMELRLICANDCVTSKEHSTMCWTFIFAGSRLDFGVNEVHIYVEVQ